MSILGKAVSHVSLLVLQSCEMNVPFSYWIQSRFVRAIMYGLLFQGCHWRVIFYQTFASDARAILDSLGLRDMITLLLSGDKNTVYDI
jgi:hypothetical protein